jgi:bifunctional UDP-N-acetylglucosamine pyrophosphorylase/glucosamine-1-phosphate N-acetyltransferase
MASRAAIILAAGKGTRMKSDLPKVLHAVGGRPMLDWSIDLARQAGCDRIFTVCSPSADAVCSHVRDRLGEEAIILQDPPLGTGHAVSCARAVLEGFEGDCVILYADTPLIQVSAVEALFAELADGATVGVLGFEAAVPGAYGRLVTDGAGQLDAIIEANDATGFELRIRLCNSGVLAASARDLLALLSRVTNDNAKGEYYLTDIVALAREEGGRCQAVTCDEADVLGVNSRVELAQSEAAFQQRRREALLLSGVTMTAPETVFFSHDTQIGPDVVIEPNVVFGLGVQIESGARIRAFSHLEGARVEAGCEVGPFARLRPGTHLEAGAKIGNFVEVKKTRIGKGAKANHLAYLGDGDVGEGANIGAGTIFCNYDGFQKHETNIGRGAFIGSNTALVAPVAIGDGAYVGSGSVITEDVEPNALALARGQQSQKPGWATRFRDKYL